jgi:hypothetical protein
VTPHLPVGPLGARDGHLVAADGIWRVGRWWQPPRPRGLAPPPGTPAVLGVDVPPALEPARLVGAGAGLTPSGDDVLAGALVAAHATAHPRLREWRAATRTALSPRSTTAVSRALLTHALDGWAIPELAEFVVGACSGDAERAATGLLAVGHSSGAALAAGVLYALDGRALEGAA